MPKADLSAADQCVMCGMCQPHCPTYRSEQIESESPRGRLSLMLGLAQGQLQADHSVASHLNHCSGCGACEAMCPSRVPFMQLMDNSKSHLPGKNTVTRVLLELVRQPARYRLLNALLSSQRFGNFWRFFGFLSQHSKSLQTVINSRQNTQQLQPFYPATSALQGNVGLFTGCITQLFDQTTLTDSIQLLTHCGYNVHVPKQQGCCGALHQHNGEQAIGTHLLRHNQQVFDSLPLDAIIFTATGCGAQLTSTPQNTPVMDIMQFINQFALLSQLKLQPLTANVLIHEPCSQRNQLKLPAITPLMQQIPGITLQQLAENPFCCGAGGINLLTQTDSANKLRLPKILDIQTQQPDMVISTNYGCALHLASGTVELSENKNIEFCHPVSLLVRSASLQ